MNLGTEQCLHVPLESYLNYIKKFNPKLNTKTYEVVIGCALVKMLEQMDPNKQWVLGFPIKHKYLNKYSGRSEINDEELAYFLESNEREEATHTDLVISNIDDNDLQGTISYQVKRFGVMPPRRNDADLVALLSSLERNPTTGVNLVIHLRHWSAISIGTAREWIRDKSYPYNGVELLSIEGDPYRMVVRSFRIYPQYMIGTFGFKLLPDPDRGYKTWLRDFYLIFIVYATRMRDYVTYKLWRLKVWIQYGIFKLKQR